MEKLLDSLKIPKHVAIIMDGNRRWAKKHAMKSILGYWHGAEKLIDIVKASVNLGIEVLTVYAFSTENWSRDPSEVNGIMNILEIYLTRKIKTMKKANVRLNVIGNIYKCSEGVQRAIERAIQETKDCTKLDLVLAINYGGRDEIRRATVKILEDYERKKVTKEALTEEFLSKYLDTHKWRDPDLLIRTSGEMRLSNFLLWQLSYSELYVTDVLWPDFSKEELVKALLTFQKREKRLGAG